MFDHTITKYIRQDIVFKDTVLRDPISF